MKHKPFSLCIILPFLFILSGCGGESAGDNVTGAAVYEIERSEDIKEPIFTIDDEAEAGKIREIFEDANPVDADIQMPEPEIQMEFDDESAFYLWLDEGSEIQRIDEDSSQGRNMYSLDEDEVEHVIEVLRTYSNGT